MSNDTISEGSGVVINHVDGLSDLNTDSEDLSQINEEYDAMIHHDAEDIGQPEEWSVSV